MAKMRTMQHNSRANSSGRVHGTKHNDRNFDTTKADNIDIERSKLNYYENCYHDLSMTFEEVELRFYKEKFGEQLRMTNEAYERNGHPERCKTMEQWKAAKRNAPEETVMQIGKMEEHADRRVLFGCYKEYDRRLQAWNEAHGRPFTTMTTALHADEAVPHIQARRVWHYTDAKGMVRIGQEKALAAAGVELPKPNAKEGQYNNRKMTFDAMCRSLWLEILQERGLEIETIPVPDGKHNRDKETMIREKYEAMQAETDYLEERSKELNEECAEAEASLSKASEELETVKEEVDGLKAVVEPLREVKADLEACEIQTTPVMFHSDEVKVKVNELEPMAAQAKAYAVNRPRLEQWEADLTRRQAEVDRIAQEQAEKSKELAHREAEVKKLEELPKKYEGLKQSLESRTDQLQREMQKNAFLTRLLGQVKNAVTKLINGAFGEMPEPLREFAQTIVEHIGKHGNATIEDVTHDPIVAVHRDRMAEIAEERRRAKIQEEMQRRKKQQEMQKQKDKNGFGGYGDN